MCATEMADLSLKRFSGYIIMLLAYITAWADILLAIPEPLAFSALWFISVLLKNVIRIAFVLYIASQLTLFAKSKWKEALVQAPSRHDARQALVVMFISLGCAGVGVLVSWLSGIANPLFIAHNRLPLLVLFPLILLSSLSVGYAEELFFRFFMIDGLMEAGAPVNAAAVVSILIFALSHHAQGIFGIGFAAVLAAFYTSLRFKGFGLHSLALGHALYDGIILLIVLA